MKILIDGDACNVINTTEYIAKTKDIECHICCDTNHLLESDYSEIHIVDSRKDSADFYILNKCDKFDIVITNDSGLAAMVLAKHAYAVNSHGFEYTNENINSYLNSRYIRSFVARKSNRQQVKGAYMPSHKKQSYSQILNHVITKSKKGI